MTRDEVVHAIATDLKIRARICALKTLALQSGLVLRSHSATAIDELGALIDGDDGPRPRYPANRAGRPGRG